MVAHAKPNIADYLVGLALEELQPRERLSILDWSRDHLQVVDGPRVGDGCPSVPWSPDDFPLQRDVVDSISTKRWSMTCLLTGPQTFGKTECAAKPVLLHALHHRRVTAMYVAASAELANRQWDRKIQKSMEADPALARLLHANPDDGGNRLQRKFTNGTGLHLVGSESIGNLSANTTAVVVCDDVQAYAESLTRKLGHPADYAMKRAASFPEEMRTLVCMGTATTVTDWLWTTMLASAFYCPFVPCLGCGAYQLVEFDRFEYDPEDPVAAAADCWMRCAGGCDHQITFDDLPAMLVDYRWVSMPPDVNWIIEPPEGGVTVKLKSADVYPHTKRKTMTAGFWANALLWPWGRTWGEIAAEWIGCQGDPDKVKDFGQNVLTRPHKEPEADEERLFIDDLSRHKLEGYCHGTVPAEADLVTLTADVHDRYLYYVVRAWRRADGTSWLVDAGTQGVHGPRKGERLPEAQHKAAVGQAIRAALEDLWKMETEGWPVVGTEDTRINAALCLIDGGYRPDAVGQFCHQRNAGQRRHKWCMTRGSSRGLRMIWPATVSRTKRGHAFREIGVDEAKHQVRELLGVPSDKPGAWHVYGDKDLEAYYRHLVSEEFVAVKKDGSGPKRWRVRQDGGPNHWWDCEVGQVAAAIACKVKLPTRQYAQPPPLPKQPPPRHRRAKVRRRY